MPDIAILFALICGPAVLHHPVLVLPRDSYQGITGIIHWGA